MLVPVQCPNPACRTVGSIPREVLGRPIRCGGCGQTFSPAPPGFRWRRMHTVLLLGGVALLTLGVVLILLVFGGGGRNGARTAADRPDPQEANVKQVVADLLEAGRKGDLEAARKLCTAELAGRFKAIKPRRMETKVRDVLVLPRTARVTVWLKQLDLTIPENEFLVTYQLVKAAEGWKVASFKLKSYWGT